MSCENCKDCPVPVADLLEELAALTRLHDLVMNKATMKTSVMHDDKRRVEALRAAREAAQEPELQEGQEWWVRCTLHRIGPDAAMVHVKDRNSDDGVSFVVHPDDIRTDDE